MADDQHVLLALQLHDHRLQALDQVLVGLQDRQTGMLRWNRDARREGWGPRLPVVRNQGTQNQLRIDLQPVVFPWRIPSGRQGTHLHWLPRKGRLSPCG